MPTHLYAEHLLNIRTLSIQASLDSCGNVNTELKLDPDGGTLTLSHDGEQTSLILPAAIPNCSRHLLDLPATADTTLSFRVPLTEAGAHAIGDAEVITPWMAPSLSRDTELHCTACNGIIIPRGCIQTWKDLPSEGWAEMMDFWHCHKPNEPDAHDHDNTAKKGYAANNELTAISQTGLVNATSFLLAANDCRNLKVGQSFSHSQSFTSVRRCSGK